MRLHLYRRNLPVWGFIITVAVLSFNLVFESRAYLLMYSSIGELQFSVLSFALQSNAPSEAGLLAKVSVDNPVDYGGLKITLLDLLIYFSSGSSTLFQGRPLLASLTDQVLAAQKTTVLTLTLQLNPQNATSLNTFYQTNGPNVTANVSLSIEVTTSFFTEIGASPVLYQQPENMTLTQQR